ncbi:DNA cytosine methyltransferase [Pseudomonas aeruginosa]|nr:DNA cytosine methyltransferase [Pseudomonas aeruginosa]
MIDPILEQVHQRIKSQRLSLQEAATSIGIGASALERHLSGEYVRSDSLAKYRLWLDGSLSSRERQQSAPISEKADAQSPLELPVQLGQSALLPFVPKRPLNVVDLFCGCGGMSLGFERFREGLVYRVAMALDIEAPMVRVFNDNHPSPSGNLPIARQSDITDFMNEAEIQGYYLDHLARTTGDTKLTKELSELPKGGIPGLRKRLRELDQNFLDELASRRSSTEYVSTIRKLGSAVLGQTSVLGFHNATKLPGSGTSYPKLGPLIWHHDGEVSSTARIFDAPLDDKLVRACGARARKLWDGEIEKLSTRATGAGRGQLASAADRINRFLEFIDTPAMRSIRSLWIDWRATREALRRSFFEDPLLQCSLRSIYEDGRQVAVLLGGPLPRIQPYWTRQDT